MQQRSGERLPFAPERHPAGNPEKIGPIVEVDPLHQFWRAILPIGVQERLGEASRLGPAPIELKRFPLHSSLD